MQFVMGAARIAYNLALTLSWPFFFLYYFCRSRTDGKYRENYRARMGLELPGRLPDDVRRAWVHALSVGEVLSSVPLIDELKKQCPGIEIVVSTATESGMKLARERLSSLAASFFFMPHDFPWAARSITKKMHPGIFILVETDFWPNLLSRLRKEGIPSVLVNGRISPVSHSRYRRMRGMAEMIFSRFDLIFTQTEQDKERFESLGRLAGKVVAAGNLKLDSLPPRIQEAEVELLRGEIGLEPGRRVWIAGSTHPGEEETLLRVHKRLATHWADLLLIVAPRDIRRRGELENLCPVCGLTSGVRSRGESASGKDVYVLDSLGELARFYSVAEVAFIGGSLVQFGGHNPLEAIAQGKPACWGPHLFNFREIEASLLKNGYCSKIFSEGELEDFVQKVLTEGTENGKFAGFFGDRADFLPGASSRIAAILRERLL